MKLIDQGLTCLSSSEIRVALLPVGPVPEDVLEDYQSMIEKYRHVRINLTSLLRRKDQIKDLVVGLSSVRSFHHEKQKSPFKHLPWNKGCLNFRFLSGSCLQSVSLSCLYASRAILGVIGVCHCPSSPDVAKAYSEFETLCKQFPNAVTLRCFAFDPVNNEINESSKQKEHLIMFPKCDRSQLVQNVEVLMHDFAACLLMELQQAMLNLSVGMMSLNSIIDNPEDFGYSGTTEEISKRLGTEEEVRLRRRHARMQKLFGDWSMLAGSPRDAFEHYNTCLELSRYCGDTIWGAAAIEGMAEAKVIEALIEEDAIPKLNSVVFQQEETSPKKEDTTKPDPNLDDAMESPFEDPSVGFGHKKMWKAIQDTPNLLNQVLAFYNEAETVYSRKQILPLQIEVEMKTVRLLLAFEGSNALPRINYVLTRILEQWTFLKSEFDRITIITEVSKILKAVGLHRKRALLLWEALETSKGLETTDLELLSLILKSEEVGDLTALQKDIKHLTKGVFHSPNWLPLQKAMVDAILSIASKSGMEIIAWEAASTLLRDFFNVIPSERQTILMEVLKQSSSQMSSEDKKRNSAGPPPYFQVRNVCRLADALKPCVCDELKETNNETNSKDNTFIFNPYDLKRKYAARNQKEDQSRWIVGEECSLEVYISNPSSVQLKIERLCLSVEDSSASPISVAVVLPPRTKPTRVSLSLIPNVAGTLKVIGCHVTLFGVAWLQRFVTSLRRVPRLPNVQFVDPEWGTEKNMVVELDILPSMPLLKWQFMAMDSDKLWPAALEEITKLTGNSQQEKEKSLVVNVRTGEILSFKLRLTNASDLPINRARLIPFQKPSSSLDSTEYFQIKADEDFINKKLPLFPSDVIELPVKVLVHHKQSANSIPSKIKMRYGGPQVGSNLVVFGRELTAPLTFKILPSVNVRNVQIIEQNVPIKIQKPTLRRRGTFSGGMESVRLSNHTSISLGSEEKLSVNGSMELDVEEVKTGNLNSTRSMEVLQHSSSVGKQTEDEIFGFRTECGLKITIANQGTQVLCVWVDKRKNSNQSVSSGQWLPPPAPESHSVVPGQAVQVSCVIPKMDNEVKEAEGEDLNMKAATWIITSLCGYWQTVVHQPTFTNKDEFSSQEIDFHLTPSYGSQGIVPLRKDHLVHSLTPQVLSLITRSYVTLSIQLAEPFTKGFTDLRNALSTSEELNSILEPHNLLEEALEEWTIQAPEYEETNQALETSSSHRSELPNAPKGPNGEIWGIQLDVGEFLNCQVLLENNTKQGLENISITICTERIDEIGENSDILFRREGGLSDTGILLVGPISNIPVSCPANSTFKHRFCLCCLMPGLYNIFVCENSPESLTSSFVQGFRFNVLCRTDK